MAGPTGGEFEPAEHGLIPVHHPLEQQYKRGASWFYWIAGLTALNSLVYLLGQDLNFLIGLGITQVIDVFAEMLTTDIPEATLILRIFSIGVISFLLEGLSSSVFWPIKRRDGPTCWGSWSTPLTA